MKVKTSVALDEETLLRMRKVVRRGHFRNKSHLMEFAINCLIEEIVNE